MKRDIDGIGCGAHIMHSCVQNSHDAFPIEVEALVVKIYRPIYIYIFFTYTQEVLLSYKRFCDEA
jgi:hypothetical protein